tara:strand:+ start:1612 stop:1722 length:111 start_codon:yes stop_codon:yes gene_type:complete
MILKIEVTQDLKEYRAIPFVHPENKANKNIENAPVA